MLLSSQEVEKISAVNCGTAFGLLVIILINPPTASLPYKVDAAPFTTSIFSIIEFGIPDKP